MATIHYEDKSVYLNIVRICSRRILRLITYELSIYTFKLFKIGTRMSMYTSADLIFYLAL